MVFLFALLETTAKSLSEDYSIPLIVWFRYVTHCLLMVVLLGPGYGLRLVKTKNLPAQLVRAALLMGSTLFYFTALSEMPLAIAKSISFVAPLLVTVFAFWLLKENVGINRWVAVFVGFMGVLLIVNPVGSFNWYFLFPVVAATCYSLYQIMTRRFSEEEHPVTTLFYTALVGALLISFAVPWFWQIPDAADLPKFLFLGFAGGFGHFMLIKAMGLEDASFLSPLTYVQLLWVTFFGFVVFGDFPDLRGLIGMTIIVGAGLYVVANRKARKSELPVATSN